MNDIADLLTPSPVSSAKAEMPADGTPTVIGGQYHTLHPETGKRVRFQRASNFAKVTDDTYRLELHKMRQVLLGAAMRPDITAQAIAAGAEDKKRLDELAAAASEAAGGSKAANLGTAMHDITEQVDRGLAVPMTEAIKADVDAYQDALRSHGIAVRPHLMERVVCNLALGVVGRFDNVYGVTAWGQDAIGDKKTGGYLAWQSFAIQLAVYANAEWLWEPGIDGAPGSWVRMPPVDRERGLIIHLPIGEATCTPYELDLVAGWEGCQLTLDVKAWRNRKGLGTVFQVPHLVAEAPVVDEAAPPAAPVGNAFLADRIAWLKGRLSVAIDLCGAALPVGVFWPAEVPTFANGGPTTWDHAHAVEAFLNHLEREIGAPFPPPEPSDPFAGFDGSPSVQDRVPASRPAPAARPEPGSLTSLRDRFVAIPNDLREIATAEARAAGLPADQRKWTADHVPLIEQTVAEAEMNHNARKAFAAALVQGAADDELAAYLDLAAEGRSLDALLAIDVERLEALINAAHVGLDYELGGSARVQSLASAETALIEAFGSRTDALAAAKQIAARYGRPKPTSAAKAASDPVLVALLLRQDSGEAA